MITGEADRRTAAGGEVEGNVLDSSEGVCEEAAVCCCASFESDTTFAAAGADASDP